MRRWFGRFPWMGIIEDFYFSSASCEGREQVEYLTIDKLIIAIKRTPEQLENIFKDICKELGDETKT